MTYPKREATHTIHARIMEVLHRYYRQQCRNARTIIPAEGVRPDASLSNISRMLVQPCPHDNDYNIFRVFQEKHEIILDIGAHWGYSVGSMRAVGVRSKIISFEAVPWYLPCLDAIKSRAGDQYDYRLIGLSDTAATLRFVVPTIDGVALGALASAAATPDLLRLTDEICDFVHRWMPGSLNASMRLCELDVNVETLDDVIRVDPTLIGSRHITAVKIDVEGLEYHVLKGAAALLASHKPLVMVEAATRRPGLLELMSRLDYFYAERSDSALTLHVHAITPANGFFVHRDHLAAYRRLGILR